MTIPWLPFAAGLARGTEAYQQQQDRQRAEQDRAARLQLAAAAQARQQAQDEMAQRTAGAELDLNAYKAGLVRDEGQGGAMRDAAAFAVGGPGGVDPSLVPEPKPVQIGGQPYLRDMIRLAATRGDTRQNRYSFDTDPVSGQVYRRDQQTGAVEPTGTRMGVKPQKEPEAPSAVVIGTTPDGRPVYFDPKKRTTGVADIPPGAVVNNDPQKPAEVKAATEIEGRERMLTRLDAFENALSRYEREGLSREVVAELENTVTSAQMEAKNYQELGALAGPDLKLIDRTITNPLTGRGMVLGTNGIKRQIALLREQMRGDIDQRRKRFPRLSSAPSTGGNASAPRIGKLEAAYQAQRGRQP